MVVVGEVVVLLVVGLVVVEPDEVDVEVVPDVEVEVEVELFVELAAVTVKFIAFDVPPPGAGLVTVIG